jgi:hypothetical protein
VAEALAKQLQHIELSSASVFFKNRFQLKYILNLKQLQYLLNHFKIVAVSRKAMLVLTQQSLVGQSLRRSLVLLSILALTFQSQLQILSICTATVGRSQKLQHFSNMPFIFKARFSLESASSEHNNLCHSGLDLH